MLDTYSSFLCLLSYLKSSWLFEGGLSQLAVLKTPMTDAASLIALYLTGSIVSFLYYILVQMFIVSTRRLCNIPRALLQIMFGYPLESKL